MAVMCVRVDFIGVNFHIRGGTMPHGSLGEDEVRKIQGLVEASIDRSTKVMLSHSADAVRGEFSESFSSAGGDFAFKSRDEVAQGLRSGKYKYEAIRTKVENIAVPTPGVAVVTGVRSVKGVIDGNDFASTFPFKAVHALEDGSWKVVLWAVNC